MLWTISCLLRPSATSRHHPSPPFLQPCLLISPFSIASFLFGIISSFVVTYINDLSSSFFSISPPILSLPSPSSLFLPPYNHSTPRLIGGCW
ncbi:hypothetical protein L1887_29175 [Cichorium endivia]|nr:hypothetical protein L1887_29175 [Cichorium endivia]